MNKKQFWTTKDLAAVTGMDRSYIRRLIMMGRMEASKPGGRDWLVDDDEARRWLESRGIDPDKVTVNSS
ncbi:MAG: helix-turn-helix domain-containing protein [Chloroflexi bacterium]|nr:helix-turn-helix domain-containing protein [Chloroflexota bacterium]